MGSWGFLIGSWQGAGTESGCRAVPRGIGVARGPGPHDGVLILAAASPAGASSVPGCRALGQEMCKGSDFSSPHLQGLSFITFVCYVASSASAFLAAPLLEFLLALYFLFADAMQLNDKWQGLCWPMMVRLGPRTKGLAAFPPSPFLLCARGAVCS